MAVSVNWFRNRIDLSVVAILGSARNDGNARQLFDAVLAECPATRFDLSVLSIRDYEYDRPPDDDDFLKVALAIAEADAILLVTPVYWYTMSGVLKRFMDRLTDLTTVMKPLGRKLAGRTIFVAACGSDSRIPEGFEVPFRNTAAYLNMNYGGIYYCGMRDDEVLSEEARADAAAFGANVFGSVGIDVRE